MVSRIDELTDLSKVLDSDVSLIFAPSGGGSTILAKFIVDRILGINASDSNGFPSKHCDQTHIKKPDRVLILSDSDPKITRGNYPDSWMEVEDINHFNGYDELKDYIVIFEDLNPNIQYLKNILGKCLRNAATKNLKIILIIQDYIKIPKEFNQFIDAIYSRIIPYRSNLKSIWERFYGCFIDYNSFEMAVKSLPPFSFIASFPRWSDQVHILKIPREYLCPKTNHLEKPDVNKVNTEPINQDTESIAELKRLVNSAMNIEEKLTIVTSIAEIVTMKMQDFERRITDFEKRLMSKSNE